MKSSCFIRSTWFVVINAISLFHYFEWTIHALQLTSWFPNFNKSIPQTTDCGISAIRKVSSNRRVCPVLSLILKSAITIACMLICYLLMVAKLDDISKILRRNCAIYPREIKLALISGLIKAKTSLLLLFSLAL